MFGLKINEKLASHTFPGYRREARGAHNADGDRGSGDGSDRGGRDHDRGSDHRDRSEPETDNWGGGRQEVHGVDPGASEKEKKDAGVTAGDRDRESDSSGRVHGDTSVGKGVNKVPDSYRDIIQGKTTGHLANTPTTLGQRPQQAYNEYGDYSASTLDRMLDAQQQEDLADRAWASGDYGSWLSHSLSSFGTGIAASTGQTVDSIMNSPLDFAADMARTPIGRIATAFMGPVGMAASYGLQSVDNLADYVQGEATAQQALGSQLSDTGFQVGGLAGGAMSGVGKAMQGDYKGAGSSFGGAFGSQLGGYGGVLGSMVGGAIGDNAMGNAVGNAVGSGLEHGFGRGRDNRDDPTSTAPIGSTNAAGEMKHQVAANPYSTTNLTPIEEQMLATDTKVGANVSPNVEGFDRFQEQDMGYDPDVYRPELAGGTLSNYTRDSATYSPKDRSTGIIMGGPIDSTGVREGATPLEVDNARLGISIENDPRLANINNWSYVTDRGIIS